jgi:hypothetical protein
VSDARPLDQRDRSVPIKTLGFGWVWFATRNTAIFAPSVCMVRPHHGESRDPTLSIVTLIGGGAHQEITIPGHPLAIVDAIIDALGVGEPHPLHVGPRESISHMRRP